MLVLQCRLVVSIQSRLYPRHVFFLQNRVLVALFLSIDTNFRVRTKPTYDRGGAFMLFCFFTPCKVSWLAELHTPPANIFLMSMKVQPDEKYRGLGIKKRQKLD